MPPSQDVKKEVVVGAPKSDLPFSAVIGLGSLLFVSGRVGRDPQGGIASDDVRGQTLQALENIGTNLDQAGSTLAQVLKATVFITDMGRFAEMNQAYKRVFSGDLPARSCVEVSRLPDPEALVEIEVIACR
jgi:2-iminobutanoate/2-iminopropanoate deaminase